MNDDRIELMEQAMRVFWRRQYKQVELTSGTREGIMAAVKSRDVAEMAGGMPVITITPAVSRFAWAASILGVVSGVYAMKSLSGLSLTANYLVFLFLV